jgi:PEGA domain
MTRATPLWAVAFAVVLNVGTGMCQKTRIAMCELTGQGVDQPASALVSERLGAWLAEMPAFEVIAPSRVYVALKEHGATSWCKDDDTVCLSSLGKTLGADVVIAGIIAKSESIYTILLRVVDVASATVLTTGYQDVDAPIEKIQSEWTAKAAKQLQAVINTRMSNFGIVKIRSVPAGARVCVNGKDAGRTDCSLDRLLPGKYGLDITLPTYVTVRESVTVEPKKIQEVSVKLAHTKAFADSTRGHAIRKAVVRCALGCATLACAGTGFYFNSAAASAVDDERGAKSAYQNAGPGSDFNSLYQKYQDAGKKTDNAVITRNILYGLGGILAVGFAVSFFF